MTVIRFETACTSILIQSTEFFAMIVQYPAFKLMRVLYNNAVDLSITGS